MATIENEKGQLRIVRCPALRAPGETTGEHGCNYEFVFDGMVGQRRAAHFGDHDPEDFGLSPLQEDDENREVTVPVGGD